LVLAAQISLTRPFVWHYGLDTTAGQNADFVVNRVRRKGLASRAKGLGRMAGVISAPTPSCARHWMVALGAFIVIVGASMVVPLIKLRKRTSQGWQRRELRARPLIGVIRQQGQA
jgi:hypothetical protein